MKKLKLITSYVRLITDASAVNHSVPLAMYQVITKQKLNNMAHFTIS